MNLKHRIMGASMTVNLLSVPAFDILLPRPHSLSKASLNCWRL